MFKPPSSTTSRRQQRFRSNSSNAAGVVVVAARNGGAAGHYQRQRQRRVKSHSDSSLVQFWAGIDEHEFNTLYYEEQRKLLQRQQLKREKKEQSASVSPAYDVTTLGAEAVDSQGQAEAPEKGIDHQGKKKTTRVPQVTTVVSPLVALQEGALVEEEEEDSSSSKSNIRRASWTPSQHAPDARPPTDEVAFVAAEIPRCPVSTAEDLKGDGIPPAPPLAIPPSPDSSVEKKNKRTSHSSRVASTQHTSQRVKQLSSVTTSTMGTSVSAAAARPPPPPAATTLHFVSIPSSLSSNSSRDDSRLSPSDFLNDDGGDGVSELGFDDDDAIRAKVQRQRRRQLYAEVFREKPATPEPPSSSFIHHETIRMRKTKKKKNGFFSRLVRKVTLSNSSS